MFTRLEPQTVIPEHTHDFDEIIYVISGKALLYIEGRGKLPMKAGAFFRIPAEVNHYPLSVEERIVAYNMFYPYYK